jgi:RNA polymerase sigma factor (TIGR02999 family)
VATQPPTAPTDEASVDDWMPLLYEELRRIAHRERWRISAGETMGTTALVNEAYATLAGQKKFVDHVHFLRVAAVAMRRILVDIVRAQLAAKRGAGANPLPLEAAEGLVVEDDKTVMAVHEALEALGQLNPRLVQVVECRFFAGYTEPETAEALGISEATVQRDWATARVWLKRELQRDA